VILPVFQRPSEPELTSFISDFSIHRTGVNVGNAGALLKSTSAEIARTLFEKNSNGTWYLKGGESEEHECKLDFDPKKLSSVVRAIAALANMVDTSSSAFQIKAAVLRVLALLLQAQTLYELLKRSKRICLRLHSSPQRKSLN
jgi:hypothetical protein